LIGRSYVAPSKPSQTTTRSAASARNVGSAAWIASRNCSSRVLRDCGSLLGASGIDIDADRSTSTSTQSFSSVSLGLMKRGPASSRAIVSSSSVRNVPSATLPANDPSCRIYASTPNAAAPSAISAHAQGGTLSAKPNSTPA
jgi:hypothetical protein